MSDLNRFNGTEREDSTAVYRAMQ